MDISVSAQDLKRALTTCNEIAPGSSAVAEEKTGVLIDVQEDSVIFSSADDNLGVRVEVPADVTAAGRALVKASSVAGSVSASFNDFGFEGEPNMVRLQTTDKSTLKISGGNLTAEGKTRTSVRNFPLLNFDFFRGVAEFDAQKSTQFTAIEFMDGLSKVSHAASRDTSKLHLNCIQVTLTDNEVVFAATDGIQIAEFRRAAEVKGLRRSFILGLKFANIAAKLINPALDFVDLYVDDDQFFLRSGGTVLLGTLINTQFPDYTPHMEVDGLKLAVFPKVDFVNALQGLQPTVDAKSHRLVLDARKSGAATISTSSITGEAEDTDLEVQTPEDFTLHFDAVLLQNSVRQMKGEAFEFYFTPDAKGVLLKSKKDDDFRAFVCTLKKVD